MRSILSPKSLRTSLAKGLGFVLLAAAVLGTLGSPASATDVINTGATYLPNYSVVCITNATAGYTNSTTGLTDITGASCALPASTGDFAKSFIRTCFWSDATKSTATTGSIEVYVNGAAVTASKRTIASAAGNGTIDGCYVVARSTAAAQTVKLQGVSGDTNALTVANLVMQVDIIHTLK